MAMAAGEEAEASPLHLRHAPLLLFDHTNRQASSDGDDASPFFLYSIPSKRVLHKRVVEMERHRYWTTPQGWLVMASNFLPATIFLWDPFTGDRIRLPPDREGFLSGGSNPKRFLLSCKPVAADPSPSCLVLVADLSKTVLWYCRLGDDRWLQHEYDFAAIGGAGATRDNVLWSMRRLTSAGGKFYMYIFGKVVALHFSPEPVFTVIPADLNSATWVPCNGASTTQLVESHGDLFGVRFNRSSYLQTRFVVGIGVFKLDLSAQAWVKVESSLGGRAFIVHHDWDMNNTHVSNGHLLPDEVNIKLHMLGASMVNWPAALSDDIGHSTIFGLCT
ncbi:hypothetical protein HU200_065063 [Digitaria exilis]|uniref:KIB1-4 beta-propeller domain-containing protein n=1 Tax=Digitaria exilis TaxID=1010633 RepID=A0A835A2D7_9POAL|nr:hypothetical protein HU200_065063 [Digitaria exilis]